MQTKLQHKHRLRGALYPAVPHIRPHTPNAWLLQLAVKSQTIVSSMILQGEKPKIENTVFCKSLKALPWGSYF